MRIGYVMQEGGPNLLRLPLNGPAVHVSNIVRELGLLGIEVRLLVSYNRRLWVGRSATALEHVLLGQVDRGARRRIESLVRRVQSDLQLPYLNLFDSLRFSHACQQELATCDLLYERMGWMGYGGALAARRLRIPLVLEANNGDFVTELRMRGMLPKGLQLWLSLGLMQRAVRAAAHVIVTGEGHRRRFIRTWNVNSEKVTVVENGSELVGLLDRDELKSFGAPPDASDVVQVAFAGSLDPWQGLPVLVRAFRLALQRFSRLHLTIMGGGDEMPNVQRLVQELSLERAVTVTGPMNVGELAKRLAKADVGVAPYCGWMEFSGLKLFDYKAAGLATITSGENGMPLTLSHGRTGWIVPPCDENALCEAIVQVASDVERRRAMGREARLEAERDHTWTRTAERLHRVFTSVLGKGDPNLRPRDGNSALASEARM